MDQKTRESLTHRTELIRQFRIAYRGGDDGHAQIEELRAAIHHVNEQLRVD